MGDFEYLGPMLGALLVLAAPLIDPDLTAVTAAMIGAGLGVIVGAFLRVSGVWTPAEGGIRSPEAKATSFGAAIGLIYYLLQETVL